MRNNEELDFNVEASAVTGCLVEAQLMVSCVMPISSDGFAKL